MLITIDTSNITTEDREILAQIIGVTPKTEQETPATETAAPKRTRRTKAQIAADEAAAQKAEEQAVESALGEDETAGLDDSTDSEPAVSLEEVTELATKLISADRPAMVEILKAHGVRRVSEVPEASLAAFAASIREKLAA